jgi:signal transduction histidine kinase
MMLKNHSLRVQLALTYAGLALLTAAVLGGILVGVLGSYYIRAEDSYLRASAERVAHEMSRTFSPAGSNLEQRVTFAALATQTRIRVYSPSNKLVIDSGSPSDIDPRNLGGPEMGDSDWGDRPRLPRPGGTGIFGGANDSTVRSDRSLRFQLTGSTTSGTQALGYLVLSEAPASGRDLLVAVVQGWILAGAIAVVLSALAGYLLSSRISHPLVALAETSDRMAEGDLSARAPVDRGDEVGQLSESFNEMADRIETTVTALRQFVADAAHEIGTPLTALQADLELAEAESETDGERRLVRRALTQARRLEDLSTNLLRLSRIEAGDTSMVIEPVNVSVLARQGADAVASAAEQAELEFEVDVASEPLVVEADAVKLQVVVESLLDNAVKFTPSGGRVTLEVVREGASARISVADTGVGIPVAEHDKVFSRFHRARNAAAYPGSGLGLAIVRASVERFGGSVEFESSGAGTRFDVRLPLAHSSAN